MKKTLFILFLFAGFFASSQNSIAVYPDTVRITLTEHQHSFIIAYMPDKAQVDCNKYIHTILDSIEIAKDSTDKNYLLNPDKLRIYNAPVSLLEHLFLAIGSQQERLVAADNRAIQLSLMEQLQRRPDVLQRIGLIVAQNSAQNDEVVQQQGTDYLAKLKE